MISGRGLVAPNQGNRLVHCVKGNRSMSGDWIGRCDRSLSVGELRNSGCSMTKEGPLCVSTSYLTLIADDMARWNNNPPHSMPQLGFKQSNSTSDSRAVPLILPRNWAHMTEFKERAQPGP